MQYRGCNENKQNIYTEDVWAKNKSANLLQQTYVTKWTGLLV